MAPPLVVAVLVAMAASGLPVKFLGRSFEETLGNIEGAAGAAMADAEAMSIGTSRLLDDRIDGRADRIIAEAMAAMSGAGVISDHRTVSNVSVRVMGSPLHNRKDKSSSGSPIHHNASFPNKTLSLKSHRKSTNTSKIDANAKTAHHSALSATNRTDKVQDAHGITELLHNILLQSQFAVRAGLQARVDSAKALAASTSAREQVDMLGLLSRRLDEQIRLMRRALWLPRLLPTAAASAMARIMKTTKTLNVDDQWTAPFPLLDGSADSAEIQKEYEHPNGDALYAHHNRHHHATLPDSPSVRFPDGVNQASSIPSLPQPPIDTNSLNGATESVSDSNPSGANIYTATNTAHGSDMQTPAGVAQGDTALPSSTATQRKHSQISMRRNSVAESNSVEQDADDVESREENMGENMDDDLDDDMNDDEILKGKFDETARESTIAMPTDSSTESYQDHIHRSDDNMKDNANKGSGTDSEQSDDIDDDVNEDSENESAAKGFQKQAIESNSTAHAAIQSVTNIGGSRSAMHKKLMTFKNESAVKTNATHSRVHDAIIASKTSIGESKKAPRHRDSNATQVIKESRGHSNNTESNLHPNKSNNHRNERINELNQESSTTNVDGNDDDDDDKNDTHDDNEESNDTERTSTATKTQDSIESDWNKRLEEHSGDHSFTQSTTQSTTQLKQSDPMSDWVPAKTVSAHASIVPNTEARLRNSDGSILEQRSGNNGEANSDAKRAKNSHHHRRPAPSMVTAELLPPGTMNPGFDDNDHREVLAELRFRENSFSSFLEMGNKGMDRFAETDDSKRDEQVLKTFVEGPYPSTTENLQRDNANTSHTTQSKPVTPLDPNRPPPAYLEPGVYGGPFSPAPIPSDPDNTTDNATDNTTDNTTDLDNTTNDTTNSDLSRDDTTNKANKPSPRFRVTDPLKMDTASYTHGPQHFENDQAAPFLIAQGTTADATIDTTTGALKRVARRRYHRLQTHLSEPLAQTDNYGSHFHTRVNTTAAQLLRVKEMAMKRAGSSLATAAGLLAEATRAAQTEHHRAVILSQVHQITKRKAQELGTRLNKTLGLAHVLVGTAQRAQTQRRAVSRASMAALDRLGGRAAATRDRLMRTEATLRVTMEALRHSQEIAATAKAHAHTLAEFLLQTQSDLQRAQTSEAQLRAREEICARHAREAAQGLLGAERALRITKTHLITNRRKVFALEAKLTEARAKIQQIQSQHTQLKRQLADEHPRQIGSTESYNSETHVAMARALRSLRAARVVMTQREADTAAALRRDAALIEGQKQVIDRLRSLVEAQVRNEDSVS